jgi:hypothetical protein
MTESKIELTERLRREGRWSEASRFKDTALKEFRAKGMKRDEASDAAWEAMATAYPPLATSGESLPNLANATPDDLHGQDDELIDVDALVAKQPYDFARDVAWVYEHLADRNVKPQDAPTVGAWSLLTWARRYKNRFFEMVLPKAMAAHTDEEEKNQRAERRSIDEIRGILEELNQQWAEDLAANVSETVKAKVRGIVEDWARRSALTIPNEAKTDLEGHIGGLVQDCIELLAPASGGG